MRSKRLQKASNNYCLKGVGQHAGMTLALKIRIKIISDKQVGQSRKIGTGYPGISTRPLVKKDGKGGGST